MNLLEFDRTGRYGESTFVRALLKRGKHNRNFHRRLFFQQTQEKKNTIMRIICNKNRRRTIAIEEEDEEEEYNNSSTLQSVFAVNCFKRV